MRAMHRVHARAVPTSARLALLLTAVLVSVVRGTGQPTPSAGAPGGRPAQRRPRSSPTTRDTAIWVSMATRGSARRTSTGWHARACGSGPSTFARVLADAREPADGALQLPHGRRRHLPRPVADATPTRSRWPRCCAAAGYRTGIFGKWHLGDNYPMRAMDQGFDESLVLNGRRHRPAIRPAGRRELLRSHPAAKRRAR